LAQKIVEEAGAQTFFYTPRFCSLNRARVFSLFVHAQFFVLTHENNARAAPCAYNKDHACTIKS